MDQESDSTPPNEESQKPTNSVPVKTEDDLFKNATQSIELEQAPEHVPLPVKKPRKKPVFLIILLLLLVGAAAAWYFVIRETTPKQNAQDLPASAPAPSEEAPTYEPNTIAYSYQDKRTNPVTLFTRPAAGGDRKEIQKLTRDTTIIDRDTSASNVAYVDDNDIYASTDHGATYKKIFEGEAGAQITSMMIDGAVTGVVFGYLKEVGGKNEVRFLDFEGQNAKTLFTNEDPGVILVGVSTKKQRIIYRNVSCWNCDGGDIKLYSYDLAAKKRTALLDNIDQQRINSVSSSSDTSSLIFTTGTIDEDAEMGIGVSLVAPYEVTLLNVDKNEVATIANVGTAGEKNSNGTKIQRNFLTGFTAGTNTPYYTADKQLFLVRDNEELLFYEANKNIFSVEYVSDKNIIASAGEFDDFVLSNYDVESKKATTILEGDNNTRIFGVTTD